MGKRGLAQVRRRRFSRAHTRQQRAPCTNGKHRRSWSGKDAKITEKLRKTFTTYCKQRYLCTLTSWRSQIRVLLRPPSTFLSGIQSVKTGSHFFFCNSASYRTTTYDFFAHPQQRTKQRRIFSPKSVCFSWFRGKFSVGGTHVSTMRDLYIKLLEINELRKHTVGFGEFLCFFRFSET